jgi:biofilm PGA synthesis N-glycosyltransferase PgaC
MGNDMSTSSQMGDLTCPMRDRHRYVLVTPVKNEEALIGTTIASVVNQTVPPVEWVIVSDGSTDGTDEIIKTAGRSHPWIRLLSLPPRAQRSFAAVVHATEAGIRALAVKDYEFLGLLDSDVRFQPDYFEKVLGNFEASPRLGLAGGVVIDVGMPKDRMPRNRSDVPGAVQFFRRKCFEELGGLIPVPEGGWDGLTCACARMRGYQTRLLTDLVVDHLKPRNSAEGGLFRRNWQMGVRDYAVGYHPLFELVKCLGRWSEPPVFIGAIAWWVGYCCAALRCRERLVPADLIRFVRSEQIVRLKQALGCVSHKGGGDSRHIAASGDVTSLVLNFHGVGPIPREISDGERNCWLETAHFEAVLEIVRGQPHVELTFDDGNASDVEIVLPALLGRGLRATFFICSGRLDQPTFLSRSQVRELRAAGMGIGSHGIDHTSWRRLAQDQLAQELASSRQILEEVCGSPVVVAACPFGDYDRRVLKGLRQAGYRQVYTSDGGTAAAGDWLKARATVTRSISLDYLDCMIRQGPGVHTRIMKKVRKLIKRLR